MGSGDRYKLTQLHVGWSPSGKRLKNCRLVTQFYQCPWEQIGQITQWLWPTRPTV